MKIGFLIIKNGENIKEFSRITSFTGNEAKSRKCEVSVFRLSSVKLSNLQKQLYKHHQHDDFLKINELFPWTLKPINTLFEKESLKRHRRQSIRFLGFFQMP